MLTAAPLAAAPDRLAFHRELRHAMENGELRLYFQRIVRLEGDRARVKSNFLMVRQAGAGPLLALAGTYEDVVARTPVGWRFQSREIRNDIVGDLGLKR